jgi:hypothetical protein
LALTLPDRAAGAGLGALDFRLGLRSDKQPAHGQHRRGGSGDDQVRGHGKTAASKTRQAEVTNLEANQIRSTAKVAALAKPESGDFVKLVTWVSRGAIEPGADDFSMLWLLFRTFLPQQEGSC